MNKEAGHSFSVKMITELKIIGEAGTFCGAHLLSQKHSSFLLLEA